MKEVSVMHRKEKNIMKKKEN